jgi:GNAT superfamily N-acetyltransferase
VPVLGRVAGGAATERGGADGGGYRYVALVATNPAHQKRGFAEAAMRRALTIAEGAVRPSSDVSARHGRRPADLRAHGYEAVSTHTCFIDKRLLPGH